MVACERRRISGCHLVPPFFSVKVRQNISCGRGIFSLPSNADVLSLLMLNPEKTKLMVFGSRPMIKLSLLGKELVPSESIKDLGVTFDRTLSFDNHISVTVSSCASKLTNIN